MNIIIGKHLVIPSILAFLSSIAHILNKLVYIKNH